MAVQTTLRGMAGAAAGAGATGATTGSGAAATSTSTGAGATGAASTDDDDDEVPKEFDIKRAYNENRKLQRLLSRSQKEIGELRQQVDGFGGVTKKIDAMKSIFAEDAPDPADSTDEINIYSRAQKMHERAREVDPDSPGMPLTMDMARYTEDAYKLAKDQAKVIADLTARLDRYEKPQYVAEQQLFVNLESMLRDEVELLFEDANLGSSNYPDFERIAIEKIKAMRGDKSDPRRWQKFIASPKLQQEFVKAVIESKIPRAYLRRQAGQMIEEYSADNAQADMLKAQQMKAGPERAALMKKARQRLLPEMLGVDIRRVR